VWQIRTEGTGYCCRHWVFEREQESIVRWVFFFVRGESLLRHFLCFSFGSSRRGKVVSRNKEALTFRWRRRGARDSGGDVVSMCNFGMYRSLREVRNARVGSGGVSTDDTVGTSVAGKGTERTSALDRSTEMGDPVEAVGSGDFV